MTNDSLSGLARRLALAEREIASARADVEITRIQVKALLDQNLRWSRAQRRDRALGLLGLVLLFTALRSFDTQAQGTPQKLTVRAPFVVVDDKNVPIMTVDHMGHGRPRGIAIHSAESHQTAGIIANKTGDGLVYVVKAGASDSTPAAVTIGVNTQGNGRILVKSAEKTAIDLETDEGGNGRLAVNDAQERPILKIQDKGQSKSGDARGLHVFNEKGQIATQSTVEASGAGAVKVLNPAGVTVGGLLANESGGGLALTGPAGGKSAVSLSVAATGGKVRVFPQAGGSAQAELTAGPAGGEFTAYNSSGSPIGFLGSKDGKGYLELNDANGTKMMVAGSLAGGKGYVMVTPWRPSPDVRGDPSVLKGGGK